MSAMSLSEELIWRGFVNQHTFNNLNLLDKGKWVFYNGYDASVDSLTIGNLATVMFNKTFIRHGAKPIILAGGATSLIGDPGGKDTERPLQTEEQVAKNVAAVKRQLEQLLGGKVELVNNLAWFSNINVLDFLRDVGKHFSMTPLVQRDYIATRMGKTGNGISYTEFSYTLLQGYDYLYLHKKYGVNLQLAGSDQWGNALSGVELVRKVTGKQVHALTMPLIIDKNTGKKFGKSEAGAVWLDASKTSPNEFYQFWVNIGDEAVGDYLKIFTELNKDEIAKVMTEFEKDRSSRHAQHVLAYEVTKLVHGPDEANKSKDRASILKSAKPTDLAEAAQGTAAIGEDIIDVLVRNNLASSKTEARQLLSGGGIYINDQQTTKPHLGPEHFKNNLLALRRGKALKNTVVLKLHRPK